MGHIVMGGVGIAILLIIDQRNHFVQSESSFHSKTGVSESPFYSYGSCGSTSCLI